MELIREVTLSRAEDCHLTPEVRKQWAKLSLRVNARMHGDEPWQQARMAMHDAALRTRMIEQLGADANDPDWDPAEVVADVLGAVTPAPAEAHALCAGWQALPIEQIGALRRIKNVTASLARLVDHLQPGPLHAQAQEWVTLRQLLP
ncbi:hypothetical protein OG523_03555 [Streptomyces virginiae]|uniref:hypothetical protein n=1 Tax=Streptomyces virginiae TaxID=1961 RepID=UPI002E372806|nr:hypothetical protein [Streptomyces virginiae]